MAEMLQKFCDPVSINASNCSDEMMDEFRSFASKEAFTNRVPLLVYIVLVGVVGLVGNTIVIVVYWAKYCPSAIRVFIISMAISDLFINLLTVPVHVVSFLSAYNADDGMCKAMFGLTVFPTMLSVFLLVAVAMERFNHVCRLHRRQLNSTDAMRIVAALLMAVIALFIPFETAHEAQQFDTGIPGVHVIMCLPGALHYSIFQYIYGSLFCIGFLLIILAYGSIALTLTRSRKKSLSTAITTAHHTFDRQIVAGQPSRVHCKPASGVLQASCVSDSHSDKQTSRVSDLQADKQTSRVPDPQAEIQTSSTDSHADPQTSRVSDLQADKQTSRVSVLHADPQTSRASVLQADTPEYAAVYPRLSASGSESSPRRSFTAGGSPMPIKRQSNETSHSFGSRSQTSPRARSCSQLAQTQSTRMMAALTLVYVADTLPTMILAFGGKNPPAWCENLTDCGYNVKSIALSSYYLNSMANAFVYGFISVRFRDSFKDLFRAWRRKL